MLFFTMIEKSPRKRIKNNKMLEEETEKNKFKERKIKNQANLIKPNLSNLYSFRSELNQDAKHSIS